MGREKLSFPLENLHKNKAAAIEAPIAAASGRAQKCYKTRWAGENFHSKSGIYLKIDAAAIVATVA